jgi:hypothetical protein
MERTRRQFLSADFVLRQEPEDDEDDKEEDDNGEDESDGYSE